MFAIAKVWATVLFYVLLKGQTLKQLLQYITTVGVAEMFAWVIVFVLKYHS